MFGTSTIVEYLGENLRALFPFVVIRQNERGVRLWCGVLRERAGGYSWTGELPPGVWMRLPIFWTIDVVCVAEDSTNLPLQDVTTKDDHAVSFDANILFEITDPVAYKLNVTDFDSAIANASMIHMAQRVRDMAWADLLEGQSALEKSLRGTLTTRAKRWGVTIKDVGLTTMVKARTFRLVGGGFGA